MTTRKKPKRRPARGRKLRGTSVRTRPGKNGGTLRTGNPGNAGRPSQAFKDEMARLAEDGAQHRFMRTCLTGRKGYKAYFAALAYCSERAWGKPVQPVAGGDLGPIEGKFIIEFVDAK